MNSLFYNATAFNQPIGAWNTGAVTNMNYMFNVATSFNQNISEWNVVNVTPKPPTGFSNGSKLTAQTSPFGVTFTAPVISNSGIVTYSGNMASMTYTVAFGVTAVQVRKASDNTVIAATTFVSGTSASVSSVTITENTSIVVVALGNAVGRESAASAPQTLLTRFAAPVKASEPVYTTVSAGSYTASMTYTVAAGVSAVQVRKASDNTAVSGATSSMNSLIATITVPSFTKTYDIVVVALTNNDIGRESLPSVAQTLVGQYDAPTLSGSVTYSGNTASMTYSVNPRVTAVTVLKSDLTALPADVLVNTIINAGTSGRTMSVLVAFTTSMSIVVIAQGNASGSQSAASAPLALLANFTKPTLGSITYSGNTAIMTYTVAEGVSAVSVLQPNLSALPSDATVTTNTLSGTTATLHISLSGSRGSLSFVVVALVNATGRQSASDTQFISTGISDVTFTKSSNLWYFGFNCSNPSSVSGLNIHMTWTFSPGDGVTGLTNNYSSATIANGANSLLISDPNNWLNIFLTGKPVNVSINYVVSGVSKNIATSFIPIPLTGGPYTLTVSDVNANTNTCTLVIPAALDQQRVAQNRTWIYSHYFIDATTNATTNPNGNPNGDYTISGSLQSSISNVQVPLSLWGRPLRNALLVLNNGGNSTGDYVVQQRFTSNDIYTLPNPTVLFPVETNEIITYGMNWQTTGEINDVRVWRVSWTVHPNALDVASPNYVSKVRIRIKRGDESTYRFTGVYNYADGAGYAMLHTNVYTNLGQNVGTWSTEIRAENADGTITTNYAVSQTYYGAHYVPYGNYYNLTQLASVANGYTLLYGDNVINLF
jgi:surface protein